MTKKDVQKFDRLIKKTFHGDAITFEEIIKIFVNILVQQNAETNRKFMDRIADYCNEKQAINFLTDYFEFSNTMIFYFDGLDMIQSKKEYEKLFNKFVSDILSIVPKELWQQNIYAAMGELLDVVNSEYDIASYKVDDNFFNTLENIFRGLTPMTQLYLLIHQILNEKIDMELTQEELLEDARILFSFIFFANILRKKLYMQPTTRVSVNNDKFNTSKQNSIEKTAQIYQLKISIKGARPPIWRQVLVESDKTFYDLHTIIQTIFNWENYHLYEFQGNVGNYGDKEMTQEEYGYNGLKNYRSDKIPIDFELKKVKNKIYYTYDFGDDWGHEIVLEKILTKDEKIKYPMCIAGKRNGPLEDCGGMWGYQQIVYAIENQDFDGLEDLFDEDGEFYYQDFDPSLFDKKYINNLLQKIK